MKIQADRSAIFDQENHRRVAGSERCWKGKQDTSGCFVRSTGQLSTRKANPSLLQVPVLVREGIDTRPAGDW